MPPESGASPLPDIKDIAGPDSLPSLWETIGLFAGIVAGLALLVGAAVWIFRATSRGRTAGLSPLQQARQRLTELAAQADTLPTNAFSVAVSDTLKDFLSQRFGDPVRFETSEEFLVRLSQTGATTLPPATREAVARFLGMADEIKYGRPRDAEGKKLPLLELARETITASVAPQTGVPHSPAAPPTLPGRRIISK